jgi:two-component system sensor histidine kinase MprB
VTLRTRLAVALAALAALSVVAVASISYAATSQRLYGEVDDALVSAALDLGGPGGERLAGFCEELLEVPLRYGPEGPLAGLRGEIVQCIDAGGRVVAARGPVGVPVEQPGEDVTDRPGAPATTVGGHGPPPRPRPWTQRLGGQPYRVVAVPLAGGGEVRIGRSLAETNRVLGSVRSRSILVGLAIMVLAAAAGVLIARRTTRPVTRLTDAAEEIAASGRLDIAVPASTRDGRNEIGRLARAFSSMLASLTRSRDQQQRLVQDAGHELRTPLTSLRANIDTLRRYPDLDPAPRAGVLADLDSELRELSALVDELVAGAGAPDPPPPPQTGARP